MGRLRKKKTKTARYSKLGKKTNAGAGPRGETRHRGPETRWFNFRVREGGKPLATAEGEREKREITHYY